MLGEIALGLSALWTGAGVALAYWYGRPAGSDCRRGVSRWVCARGDLIRVSVNAVPPAVEAAAVPHEVVLLLDVSGSMGSSPGSPSQDMIRAATQLVEKLPAAVRVAVVAFNDAAECLCPLTADRRRVIGAVENLTFGGDTAIAAALRRAERALDDRRPDARCTVALFTDGKDGQAGDGVRAAADALRAHPAAPRILCAGFGDAGTRTLLNEIAGSDDLTFFTAERDRLHELFVELAAEISGRRAATGLATETLARSRPLSLEDDAGVSRVAVAGNGDEMKLYWSLPRFDGEPATIGYTLRAECLGWHQATLAPGGVVWRMADGTSRTVAGPRPPRILVLPKGLVWAWPVLNPLLMTALRAVLRRRCGGGENDAFAGAPQTETVAPPPALPPALPAPAEPVFRAAVRPTLAIGFGEAGLCALRRLSRLLDDREVDRNAVRLLAVGIGPGDGDERSDDDDGVVRVEINVDFRSRVEEFRFRPPPETLAWLPVRRWLSECTPLSTARGAADDRALACFSLLSAPEKLETAVQDALSALAGQAALNGRPPLTLALGAVDDAAATGVLAETAHICAGFGASTTAILMRRETTDRSRPGATAFALEMESLLARRGDVAVSDRGGKTTGARNLFDQAFVVGERHESRDATAERAVALAWGLAAYPSFAESFAPPGDGRCRAVAVDAVWMPQRALWRWVRNRVVERALPGARPGADESSAALSFSAVDAQEAARRADALWTRRGPALFPVIRATGAEPETLFGISEQLPAGGPYHERAAFCDAERRAFGVALAGWADDALSADGGDARGLLTVRAAVAAADERLSVVVERLNAAADAETAASAAFASGLAAEMQAALRRLGGSIDAWIAAFTRAAAPSDRQASDRPAADRQAGAAGSGTAGSGPPGPRVLADKIEQAADAWIDRHAANLRAGVRLFARCDPATGRAAVRLKLFDAVVDDGADLVSAVEAALDRHRRDVLAWPDADWFRSVGAPAPAAFGVIVAGRCAADAFGPHAAPVDASDHAAAIRASSAAMRLLDAFDLPPPTGLLPCVRPEDFNAARLSLLVRRVMNREPVPAPPALIGLMRDPDAFLGFMYEVALGRVRASGGRATVERNGAQWTLAEKKDRDLDFSEFRVAVEHAVHLRCDWFGAPLPPAPPVGVLQAEQGSAGPDELVLAVERSPVGAALSGRPEWAPWADALRGAFLNLQCRMH